MKRDTFPHSVLNQQEHALADWKGCRNIKLFVFTIKTECGMIIRQYYREILTLICSFIRTSDQIAG